MMKQWTIRRRLLTAFLIVTGITLGLGLYGYYNTRRSDAAIEEIGHIRLPSVQNLLVISRSAERIKAAQRTLLSAELSLTDRQTQLGHVAKAREEYAAAWKVYEPLPQTREEEAVWKKFVPAWEAWRKSNDDFFALNSEFTGLGIVNPQALQRDVQRFIGDHYKLSSMLQGHVSQGTECPGGGDPAACNFGKWLAGFEPTNPELKRIIGAARPSHDHFHATVEAAKALVASGDKDGALKLVHGEMEASATKTFAAFSELYATASKAAELRDQMGVQLMTACRAKQLEAVDLLDQLVDINEKVAAGTATQSEREASTAKMLSLVAAGVGVVAALLMGFMLSQGINGVLKRVCDVLRAGAEQTASAAGQVSASSQALAEGSSEQAASLEETSSSLEEMSSMTQRNADNAQKANELARAARGAADRGAADMETMSGAMEAIKQSSADIAKIFQKHVPIGTCLRLPRRISCPNWDMVRADWLGCARVEGYGTRRARPT